MTAPNDLYNELLYLTEQYLLQEYKLSDWIYAEPETYAFFKQLVSAPKKQSPATPPPPEVQIKTESAPIPEAKIVAPVETVSQFIKLELMDPSKPVDFTDIRAILKEKFPHLNLIEEPARKITEALLLYTPSPSSHQLLLGNLMQAIELCLCPITLVHASKIESSNGWDQLLKQPRLKIVLMLQQDMELLPHLSKHYIPGNSPTLGKIPLVFLPDLALLLKEPMRKQDLWTMLNAFFAASKYD